jgi:uncharacterized protein
MKEAVAVAIFFKNPLAGKTKTRLARKVGDQEALRIYHRLVQHLRQGISTAPYPMYVYFSDFIDPDLWPSPPFEYRLQAGEDLGERMLSAFEELLERYQSVLLIGTDTPVLTPALLEEAHQKLLKQRAVLGPSEDGGYYLIGLQEPHRELFREMPWSTDLVCALTSQRLEQKGIQCGLLAPMRDVDTLEDWIFYQSLFPDG